MPSTRSASPSPVPDAGTPPDGLELSREFVEDRYKLAKGLHDARENIIRFQDRWQHELQTQDHLLDGLISHLRRFIPQMNPEGLVMLNECVLRDNLNHTSLDNGIWYTYAPEIIFPQHDAEKSPEVVVIDDDEEESPSQGQPVSEEEVVAFLEEISATSSARPAQAEKVQDAEHPAETTSNRASPSAEVLGKRSHPLDEEDDGADTPPPSPTKKQRHERSWSPSPSPGLLNSASDTGSPTLAASTSATPAPAPARPCSSSSSRRSSTSRSPSPISPTAGPRGRRSPARASTPPRLNIIADHVVQPPRSPSDPFPSEQSIMAVDLGRGGLEIFERREAQRRLGEYQASLRARTRQATVPLLAPAPGRQRAPRFPVAGPSGPAPTGTTLRAPGLLRGIAMPMEGGRERLTRINDFSTVTYFRSGPLFPRETLREAGRQQEEQTAAAPAPAASAPTTAAGPSRAPKHSPKRRRAAQDSADEAEREEAAASADEERPAKRRSPSPPVAGPSNASPSRRARKSDSPTHKGKQPVRRSARNKGASS